MPDLYITPELLNKLLISALIFLGFLVFRKLFTTLLFSIILKLTKKTKSDVDTNILLAFENPIRVLLIIIGIYAALSYLPITPNQQNSLDIFLRSFIIIAIAWGLYNLADTYSGLFQNLTRKLGLDWDPILFPFLSKSLRFIVVALAFSIIVQEWGYNIEGFIAGLGLGGLAFALAAQDTVKNIFGGIVIITERPFSIGDWIFTPSVEGTVLDITFRSTKIRTFAQAVTTIPNSTLANEAITNWSRMGKRRINFNLRVTYDTPSHKLNNALQKITAMLKNHPDIHQETIFVNLDKFGDSSLEIFLYFFTKTTVWGEFLNVKEDVNFKILSILEEEGISIGLPATAVHFKDNVNFQTTKEPASN